jgi:preprotein translocase subunit SecD
LLFWFGVGPVKGFAVTLSLGVGTSLFSALLVMRL